jgi:hypothetical protein
MRVSGAWPLPAPARPWRCAGSNAGELLARFRAAARELTADLSPDDPIAIEANEIIAKTYADVGEMQAEADILVNAGRDPEAAV